ncbi:MAG: AbrB/MazE/SpoVT family DNA-binding domain-containing protein [Rhodanobacter sp.]|nr:MAG: AbrB/MazE/SpoVT family DNA-binding domain-containing protein [Rhodanobacter sp.]TAL96467.1 MAG: AbrB/MazE/SpoVT family DNA-binding domain-containing protein [Rhodanobacter sp.]TAM41378.1 MAG: AbrB/MazE/SpoVT family DNA-binding domain-containing protein [Rhodanobacter sp.]TAN26516.1 MAG: AbrB/MazE/SpoVT family DNA-binding domain-containing protein [Rhodanobacter sp.]
MPTAKVFQSGNRQAARLPRAFRFSTDEVAIFRRGDEVVLRERHPSLDDLLDPLPPWPDDITPTAIPDLPVHEREGL